MNQTPKILFVARDDGGCGFFRCVQPARFLTRTGLAIATSVLQTPTPEQLLDADLVVMQYMGDIAASNIANFCIKNNIPYMTEFDDFIQHVSPRNEGGYHAWNPSTLHVHRSMEMTRRAFGVTVSTPQLAKEYFPYNPLIYVVPNYLDKEKWQHPIVKRNDGKIRIGWVGGNAHADDLKMVSNVLAKIVKEFKGKVIFETMGMTKQELHGVFPMQEFPDQCPSCGYEGELHHFPGESQDNYPMILASKGWDIGIAPVIGNAFGQAKSDIKIKEYAAAGIPIVASPIAPYLGAAKGNAQVLFAETFEEWYSVLKDLIQHPEKRDAIVRHNREWAEGNWIQDNIKKTFEVYAQQIEKARALLPKKKILQ
jgi:glycosyltransferase involved in cell wall biosynthesis